MAESTTSADLVTNIMITLSIDATLIDKSRMKEVTRKNGKVAKFIDLVLIETPNGKYGDFMVKQSVTKEERAARLEMPILGNGKYAGVKQPEKPQTNGEPPEDSEPPF